MVDAHKVFEQGCKRCHNEHGADFARQKLKIVDDQLQVARTGKALAPILSNHHGVKLSEPERAALFDLFMKGIDSKGAFQHRCALCHGRAVDFAREKLHIKDDVLKSKADDKDVARFLTTHHEATPAELDTIVSMLKWQLQSGR